PASPSPGLMTHLIVGTPDAEKWQLKYWLDTGMPQYSDDQTEFYKLPPNLYAGEWIQGPRRLSKTNTSWLMRFQVTADADIYVGIDNAVSIRPSWLGGYDSTVTYIQNDHGKSFTVFHKRFSKGDTVTIGKSYSTNPNSTNKCVVIGKYATNMVPTYDLKPTKSYHANVAML